jgi:hypothetical protein
VRVKKKYLSNLIRAFLHEAEFRRVGTPNFFNLDSVENLIGIDIGTEKKFKNDDWQSDSERVEIIQKLMIMAKDKDMDKDKINTALGDESFMKSNKPSWGQNCKKLWQETTGSSSIENKFSKDLLKIKENNDENEKLVETIEKLLKQIDIGDENENK